MRCLCIFVLASAALATGCDDSNFRGEESTSADGKTYFGVKERQAACDVFKVDGKTWPHPAGEVAPIAPGDHVLDCSGEYSFTVNPGTVMLFDYWGP